MCAKKKEGDWNSYLFLLLLLSLKKKVVWKNFLFKKVCVCV